MVIVGDVKGSLGIEGDSLGIEPDFRCQQAISAAVGGRAASRITRDDSVRADPAHNIPVYHVDVAQMVGSDIADLVDYC